MKNKFSIVTIFVLVLFMIVSCEKNEDPIPVKYDIDYIITGEFSKAYAKVRINGILDTIDPLYSPTKISTQAYSGETAELQGYLFSPVGGDHYMILTIQVNGNTVRYDSISGVSNSILRYKLNWKSNE